MSAVPLHFICSGTERKRKRERRGEERLDFALINIKEEPLNKIWQLDLIYISKTGIQVLLSDIQGSLCQRFSFLQDDQLVHIQRQYFCIYSSWSMEKFLKSFFFLSFQKEICFQSLHIFLVYAGERRIFSIAISKGFLCRQMFKRPSTSSLELTQRDHKRHCN